MNNPRLYIASESDIKNGKVTDIYFIRTKKILEYKGLCDTKVRAELHVYNLPHGYEWGVFAGLEEALAILEGRDVNVYSIPEGTIFGPKTPLMIIEGKYCEFAELETPILGVLRHESSIATKAARIKLAAGGKTVLFFGLRALHPAVAPMADRAAYLGGCDAVSGTFSEEVLGLKPQGTMPHALIIVIGDPVEAWKAFDEIIEKDVARVALVDTFYDERYEALEAAKALGERLAAVRLDTPSSRRGNMRQIVEEVRWTLDIHGYNHVKIIVSGGLDEKKIKELRDLVDAFGVGTSIAFPPSIDISMDIVEIEREGRWIPISKRGKLPGAKRVYRCRTLDDIITPWEHESEPICRDGSKARLLMKKYMEKGRIVTKLPKLEEIRDYVLKQLKELSQSAPD